MNFNISKIIKNPARLALKVFILIWFFLIVQIVLKVTFNYWQPYVIPTPQLEKLSDFIDRNVWIKLVINGVLYTLNTTLYILCCLKQWWFKNKYQALLVIGLAILGYTINMLIPNFIVAVVLSIILPIVLKPKNWLYVLICFGLINVFQFLSLTLEGISNANYMPYIIAMLLNFDYYLMLATLYVGLNLMKRK